MNSSNTDFLKLTRADVLKLPNAQKKEYMKALQFRHRNLEEAAKSIMDLLDPGSLISILSVIGATGVGKTTLVARLVKSLVESLGAHGKAPGAIPFLYVEVGANGSHSLSWTGLYEDILVAGSELLIDKKRAKEIRAGILRLTSRRHKELRVLRDALESMIEHRRVKVLVLDEAFHLLRFGNYTSVMDTLKSIANKTGVKIVLLGTYDLFDLVTNYSQVSRRGETVHFWRYLKDRAKDQAEYRAIITKFQDHWPCKEAPSFVAISEELMEASLGCIGLLKSIFAKTLMFQLKNNGKWDPQMLAKATKSVKIIDKIRKEIANGETKVKDGTYGESFFSADAMKAIVRKMGTSAVKSGVAA